MEKKRSGRGYMEDGGESDPGTLGQLGSWTSSPPPISSYPELHSISPSFHDAQNNYSSSLVQTLFENTHLHYS